MTRWSVFRRLVRNLGFWHALRYKRAQRQHHTQPYQLTAKRARFPLWIRPKTHDINAFWEVFIGRSYDLVPIAPEGRYLIDCGAHVGCTSAWLLSQCPHAELVAVEPNPENAAMLRRNLAPYGARATVLQTGVWSRSVGLIFTPSPGRDMDGQVREARPGEAPDMQGTGLADMIGAKRIHFLKVDIEGAEAAVFAEPSWLEQVDALIVETHAGRTGPPTEGIVTSALQRYQFQVTVKNRHICAVRHGAPL